MDWALWLKALHIMAFAAWMAGMWYLPRLLVYHAGASAGSETSETFKIMERRLLKAITTPAMIVTLVTGLVLATVQADEVLVGQPDLVGHGAQRLQGTFRGQAGVGEGLSGSSLGEGGHVCSVGSQTPWLSTRSANLGHACSDHSPKSRSVRPTQLTSASGSVPAGAM